MNKRGFTLIELLGVIIILGAIAAIVLPIVTSSIDNTKKSALVRKVEAYVKAVDESVLSNSVEGGTPLADGCYNINNKGNICLDDSCTNELKINAKNKPTEGSVCFEDKTVASIDYDNSTYGYDENNSLVKGYLVTFNTNGGTSIQSQIVCEGEIVKKPKSPYKQGYKVKEWQLNGNKYNFDTTVTSDITLTAVWEETTVYTLTTGATFNYTIKSLVSGRPESEYEEIYYNGGENYIDDTTDTMVERIEFYPNGELPNGYTLEALQALPSKIVSATGETIKAYYDDSIKSIFVYSEGEIAWNTNSSIMFHNFRKLEEFSIPPNGIIGDHAFAECSSLKSITIPSNITSLSDNAFYNCKSLESITIPPGVTRIGFNEFSGCSSLTSITIPSGVTSIGSFAFANCTKLTNITFEGPTGWWYANSRFETSGTSLDLSNPSTNATYFTETYKNKFWNKS